MDAGFGKFIRNEWDLNTIDQSCDGFVATALELREMNHRARYYCQKWFGVEGGTMEGMELYSVFRVLKVLAPDTMVYYASWVGN